LKKPAEVNMAVSFYLAVSLISLGLLTVLTFSQAVPKTDFTWQKPLTVIIFSSICIFGIIAGLSPRRCSDLTHFKAAERSSSYAARRFDDKEDSITFKGHHPTCGNFRSHILSFGNKTFCAGCTGLVMGAILSLAGCFLTFIVGVQVEESSVLIFWLGFFGVVCGLLQYKIPTSNNHIHFILNVTFVLGAFFLFVGVNMVNGSLTLDLYLLALTVYWILARIELSRAEHRKKCMSCSSKPCSLSFNS
jgi:hypothetical protein